MIPIQNIFHMLAYAFSTLKENKYSDIATEDFDNAEELYAAILERGIEQQVKRGLGREYRSQTEAIPSLRGKIELSESVKSLNFKRRQLVCSYDAFTIDSHMNRIIKATVTALLRSDISITRKKNLKSLMVYFSDVRDIDLRFVDWNLRYDRNNHSYQMLMAVCWLVTNGLLQSRSEGATRVMDFQDDQHLYQLFEKFLLEYYRQEHPELKTTASYIGWVLDDGFSDHLPVMRSDVMLTKGDRVLILDAKYYNKTMQVRFDKPTIRSANLYQIFTYVKNKEAELALSGVQATVSGMLLYAKTDEAIQPDNVYQMSGNQISVQTLDLNKPFADIRKQLDAIVEAHFGAELTTA